MNLRTKILIGILILVIIAVGVWWISNNIEQRKKISKEGEISEHMKSCVENSDCTLVYGSCSCYAVNENYKDNRDVLEAVEFLDGGKSCFVNECQLENIFAICKNKKCTKIKEQVYTSGNLEEYESKMVEIKGTIKKVPLPKLSEPDHYVLCDFENFTAYHYFDNDRDEPDCIPLVKIALSTLDIEIINKNIENVIPNPLNKRVNIIGKVFIYEVDPTTCYMASIGCQKWVGVIPIEIQEIRLAAEETEQGITITTDQTEYEQGEEIEITIKNNTSQILYIFHPFEYIEMLEGKNWKKIEPVWQCPCRALCKLASKYQIEPNQDRDVIWNQTLGICVEKQAHPGKYRISISSKTGTEESRTTIYSNEFTITQK